MRRAILTLLIPLCCAASAPTSQPATLIEPQVQSLINDLGDLKSSVREDATRQLIDRGTSIRAAMIEASKSDDPEIAARAVMIMRSWPWDRPNDPPRVKQLLGKYRTLTRDQRPELVKRLLNLPENQGAEAVFRLLKEETDVHVRWSIVRLMRMEWLNPPPSLTPENLAALRETAKSLDTTADDAPVLALAAMAWKSDKPDLSTTLFFRSALAADPNTTPGQDQAEVNLVFNSAMMSLWSSRRFDEFAALLRRRADRTDVEFIAGVPEPICQLFALHAKFGPLATYGNDCRDYREYLLRPPVLYAQSYLALRQGKPIRSKLLARLAHDSSGADLDARRAITAFLQTNNWRTAATAELQTQLALIKPDDSLETKAELADLHIKLGMTRSMSSDHLLAAKELETGLAILEPLPATMNTRDGRALSGEEAKRDLQADIQGQYLQDALDRRDETEIAKRVAALQELSPQDSEIVQEMVAWLTKSGNVAAADKLFVPVEAELRARLQADPGGQSQNSLAWFLARSGRKLDEAMKLATQAVADNPKQAAFIDTLAEVHFQLGEVEEAIKLEEKAQAAEPGLPELEGQMKRFKGGKK